MRIPRLLLALLLLTCGACSSLPHASYPLRVMTYNIHAGKDAHGVVNLEQVAELITASKADVVLLQEVDRGTTRSGNVDQLEVLERSTRMHGAFGKSLDYQGGLYGIAILSRWPITFDETIHLVVDPPQERAGGSHEPRVALLVETSSPHGPIAVANTHLDASGNDHYRMQEVPQLLSTLGAHRPAPLFAGGDFNSEPQSAVHAKVIDAGLRDAWSACGKGAGLSYPADTPVKRIDYVFMGARAQCTSATVIETQASDHRPVVVDLTVR